MPCCTFKALHPTSHNIDLIRIFHSRTGQADYHQIGTLRRALSFRTGIASQVILKDPRPVLTNMEMATMKWTRTLLRTESPQGRWISCWGRNDAAQPHS